VFIAILLVGVAMMVTRQMVKGRLHLSVSDGEAKRRGAGIALFGFSRGMPARAGEKSDRNLCNGTTSATSHI